LPLFVTSLLTSTPGCWLVGLRHSEDEQPLSLVACADFLRCEQSRRNLVTQAFKVCGDLCKSEAEVAGHVFEKYDWWFNFANDSMDLGPKVSRIVLSTTFAGDAERLARVARSEAIHDSTPRTAIEGSQIRPQRRLSQAARFHSRRQVLAGERFPFDPTDCSSASQSQLQAKVQSAPA